MADAEVIVVGAGPAGSVAATLLARAGARVRLLDRVDFPRGKLCGDSLNPGALSLLRRLHLSVDDLAATPVRGMVVTGHGQRLDPWLTVPAVRRRGTIVTGEYPGSLHGLIISRARLDAALLAHALAAGVQFEPGVTVTGPAWRDGQVGGVEVTTRTGARERWWAPVVIAADGRQSRLARALGLLRTSRSPRRWAIGAYAEGAGPALAGAGACGEMHIRPDGYLGVAPLPDGLVNLCVVTTGVSRRLQDPAAFLLSVFRRDPLLRERMADARLATPVTVLGPLAVEATGGAHDGVIAAGDAAGFVDPMTGDGLRFAMAGAELAAQAAHQALAHGWTGVHRALARERRRAFAGKWRFNRALRTLVGSPLAVQAAALAARAVPAAVRLTIAHAGDVGLAREPEIVVVEPGTAAAHG